MLSSLQLPKSLISLSEESVSKYENEDGEHRETLSSEEEEYEEEEENEDNDEDLHIDVAKTSTRQPLSVDELSTKYTSKELKDMCKSKNLATQGDKKTLAQRLADNDNITLET